MTVQELIDELQKIEDKSTTVWRNDFYEAVPVDQVAVIKEAGIDSYFTKVNDILIY
jgi:hypothetical protein